MGKSVVDEAKENVKIKKQKEKDMKNIKSNSTVRTILTAILTLGIVAAFAVTFLAGFLAGTNYQKNQSETVKIEAVILSKAMAQEPSKAEQ